MNMHSHNGLRSCSVAAAEAACIDKADPDCSHSILRGCFKTDSSGGKKVGNAADEPWAFAAEVSAVATCLPDGEF